MRRSNLSIILAGSYLLLAVACIAYELWIRLYDTGNSEFAGMLSFAFTLPSSFLLHLMSSLGFGVKVGDSNTAFVSILGLSAILNAFILYFIVRRVQK